MAIAGCVFDCDGTILDSMGMWTRECVGLLERYGVADAFEVFSAAESLDMDKKCHHYHDTLGIGESGEQLYRELWCSVEQAYATSVAPFPGVREFLERLSKAGVECIVASSTPPNLLEQALSAHGLRGYFSRLVFCGDVGRGKEYPDVYLACERMLGTPRDQTWVFEDAPFGIRSAARVGFPVAGVLNDHDGRDELFVTRWSTLVVRDYTALGLSDLEALRPHVMDALVVAGSSRRCAPALLASIAHESDLVVAADVGADALLDAGVVPDVVAGDFDTASERVRRLADAGGMSLRIFPTDKDDTDLGLALDCVREEAEERGGAVRVTLACADGGRPDHALGVWGVLARAADLCPRMVADDFECQVLSPAGTSSLVLEDACGQTVSAIALLPGTVVSERGMRWELDHAPLEVLSDLGVSNRVRDGRAEVSCHAGALAVFIFGTLPE